MSRIRTFMLPLCLIAAVSSGCTAAPSVEESRRPDPSRTPSALPTPSASPVAEEPEQNLPDRKPVLEDLVLSTEGFGSLRIGAPVVDSDMVVLEPGYCAGSSELPADDPSLARWVADYPESDDSGWLFGVEVDDAGDVLAIDIGSPRFSTDRGIRLGSTVEQLLAAYPEAVDGGRGALSTVHAVRGGAGILVFEVARDAAAFGEQLDTVLAMGVGDDRGQVSFPPRAGTDNTIGGCL